MKTALLSTGAAAVGVGLALRQARETLEPCRVPLLGLAAAFVFAAQMLNFPIPGGTSGHLMGGVLAAVLLGPAAATLVITCVLIVQCLMFADGGLMALGANVFNMAIISVWGGYFVFRLCRRLIHAQERSVVFASAFAAWFGTVLGAISCAGQLAFSGTANWGVAFPAMTNVHMLIGIGEGLATGLITMAILRARPDLMAEAPSAGSEPGSKRIRYFLAFGLLLSAGLVLFVAPFACPWPDGLEAVARRFGFEARAVSSAITAPAPDYKLPFIGSVTVATGFAGLIGTLIAFGAAYCLAWLAVPVLSAGKKNARPVN